MVSIVGFSPQYIHTLEECPTPPIREHREYWTSAAGIHKQPGAIGIDRNPASRADVLCDLDRFPYPFRDNSFDRLLAIHVIEHVADVMATMEEFHRLVRPGGTVRIETPHYTDFSSFCDPTHRSHLNSFSFRYFGEDHGGFGYYTKGKVPRDFRPGKATLILEDGWDSNSW
jgi:SAM-dependent methyltransferase